MHFVMKTAGSINLSDWHMSLSKCPVTRCLSGIRIKVTVGKRCGRVSLVEVAPCCPPGNSGLIVVVDVVSAVVGSLQFGGIFLLLWRDNVPRHRREDDLVKPGPVRCRRLLDDAGALASRVL